MTTTVTVSSVKSTPSVALSASEKTLMRLMVESTGKCPSLPFFSICDQFIFDQATKINELVQALSNKGRQSIFSTRETLSYTLSLKTFFKERVVEVLSDSFICKFALLKHLSPDRDTDLFQAPFFHDKDLILKKGVSRFATFEKNTDLPVLFSCHRGFEEKISPLILQLKLAHRLYAKLALSSPSDLNLLVSPALAIDPELATCPFFSSQKQIQNMIHFLTLMDENAVKHEHVLIKVLRIKELKAVAEQTEEFSLASWDHIEKLLITFMLNTLQQHANFKAKLCQALDGELTYAAFCRDNEIEAADDMTESSFQSMLNQFVYYTSHLSEGAKEILCHIQPLLVQKFGASGIDYRFDFSGEVHAGLIDHLQYAQQIYSDRTFLDIPEALVDYMAPFAKTLTEVNGFFDDFLNYMEFSSLESLFERYAAFIASLNPETLSYSKVFNFIVLKEQLEQMLAIKESKINTFGQIISSLQKYVIDNPIATDHKEVLGEFILQLFSKLSLFTTSLSVVNKLSMSLFRDAIFDRKPFDIVFNLVSFDEDIASKITVIAPKEAEESLEVAPELEVPSRAAYVIQEPEEAEVIALRDLSSHKVDRILRAHGFEVVRTKGSHSFYRHSVMKKTVTLPVGYASIAIGTLKSIFEQAGLR